MSYIALEMDNIVLSSSPNYAVSYFGPQYYKLYDYHLHDSLMEIYGSFFVVNNNVSPVKKVETFTNLEKLFVRLDKKSFIIDMSTLEMSNIIGNILNNVSATSIKSIGETLQREFFIMGLKNVTVKIIKNINTYNNLVEITAVTKFNTVNILEQRMTKTKTSPIRIPAPNY